MEVWGEGVTDKPIRVIREHAYALLRRLRGKPEFRHAEGIVKALEQLNERTTQK